MHSLLSLSPGASLLLGGLLVAAHSATAQAPQIAKASAGVNNSTFFLGNPSASKTQSLYLPADLAGATAGAINRLYFQYGTSVATGVTLTNLTIRLGQTTNNVFVPANTFYATGLDTVLRVASYTIAPGATSQWFRVPLTRTFAYDPTQTLILDISFTGSSNSSFGTAGDPNFGVNAGKKMHTADPAAVTGSTSSSTWQHFGFDLAPTGLPAAIESAAVTCFPDPAADRLTVRMPTAATAATLSLTDVLGRTVLRTSVAGAALQTGASLPVRELPAGPYVLTVQLGEQRFTRRVNVTR